MDTLFHMWKPYREKLIAEHTFYMGQAQKRLLSQFSNIESEAGKYAEEWLEKASLHFDPDSHDPSSFYEQAYEESITFYEMLDTMRNRTRLSVIAGIFHEWDKQVRDWIIQEMSHWHHGDEAKKALWKANFSDIADLLEGLGWKVRSQNYYTSLDRCRLVVNVFKHGDGDAFQTIKSHHQDLVSSSTENAAFIDYADHNDVIIEDKHISEFSNAFISFWNDVPEYILNNGNITVPKWFEKALQKDVNQTTKQKASQS